MIKKVMTVRDLLEKLVGCTVTMDNKKFVIGNSTSEVDDYMVFIDMFEKKERVKK